MFETLREKEERHEKKKRQRFEMVKAVASGWFANPVIGHNPKLHAEKIIQNADAILAELNKEK